MTVRRPAPNRKRPTALPLGGFRGEVSTTERGDAASDHDAGDSLLDGVEQIAQDFKQTLDADPSLDTAQKSAMGQAFSEALMEQLKSGPTAAALPRRQEWTETVDDLTRSGSLSEDDAAQLMRQLDQVFAQFERHETKLAFEFSRRLASDGEESAVAWLREQYAVEEGSESSTAAQPAAPRPLRGDVVRSKSRRLRGPPA